MDRNQQIYYGLPSAGGPRELPPPIVWRKGFGAHPDMVSDEYETIGDSMDALEGLDLAAMGIQPLDMKPEGMPPMGMPPGMPPMDKMPEGFPPMGMPPMGMPDGFPPMGMPPGMPPMDKMPDGFPPMGMPPMGIPADKPDVEPMIRVCDSGVKVSKLYQLEIADLEKNTASNLNIDIDIPELNCLLATENGKYELKKSIINMSGDGKNDFEGNGAVVKVEENAKVTVEDCEINTEGILHSCLFCGDYGTLTVNNCKLVCNDGELDPAKFVPVGPGMTQAPDSMEVSGHSRLSLACGNAHCYFNNCKIESEAWAAISTDASWGDTYIEVNNSDIVLRKPGYATFADEGSYVVMNNTNIKTASHSGMICGKAKLKFNSCKMDTDKHAVFIFAILSANGSQLGELTVNGCDIHSKEDVFLLRGTNAYLDIRKSKIKADNGCLIRSGEFEDMMATKINPKEPLFGYKVLLSDMQLEGDIIHGDPNRAMVVKLSHTEIEGAMDKVSLLMDEASAWKATKDSEIYIIRKINESNIDAGCGVTIKAYSKIEEGHREVILKSGGRLIIN